MAGWQTRRGAVHPPLTRLALSRWAPTSLALGAAVVVARLVACFSLRCVERWRWRR